MVVYRGIQLAVVAVLGGFTVVHSMKTPDAWIYTWLTGLAAFLLLINRPGCPYWRFGSAIVIVLGALETVFLAWSLRSVESGPMIGHSYSLPEGRSILLTAIAVAATASTRLRHANMNSAAAFFRSLIIGVVVLGLIPLASYSLCFYNRSLPFCHAFH